MSESSAVNLRNRRNAATTAAAIKLAIFTAISVLVTGVLVVIMGNLGFGDRNEFKAVFTNATMLEPGDDVRVAGVNVGEVKDVDHHNRSQALVTFRVEAGVKVTTDSRAEIRFLNLVGDRYLALVEGADEKAATPLKDGDTIPVDNTTPALDLTTLFNGFQPLFTALTPDQVNELSLNLVQVLQGEGGTVRSLLDHTASLTAALADKDKLIGSVVTNLSETLATVDARHEQLSTLVIELKDWMQDLARDRETIGNSLDNISQLTVTVADFLQQGRPLLKEDIDALHSLSKLLNKKENRDNLRELLDRMPETMTDQTRTGTYGSWYQYYVCGVSASIKLPIVGDQALIKQLTKYLTRIDFHSSAPRCND